MYRQITFTLRQHTPIVHFHNQENALLRATEFKPKLDKFLSDVVIGADNIRRYSNWYTIPNSSENSQNHYSFRYKLRIVSSNVEHEVIPVDKPNAAPLFFGNMGDVYRESPKYLSWTDDNINLTFTFPDLQPVKNVDENGNEFEETLDELISSFMSEFLMRHNFGTRQSKGLGSFYLSPDDPYYVDLGALVKDVSEEGILPYKFHINTAPAKTKQRSKTALEDLQLFYRVLRSGFNKPFGNNQFYIKSVLWQYCRSVYPNLIWDKKKIKQHFFSQLQLTHEDRHRHSPGFSNSPVGYAGSKEYAIKDLLGLSSTEAWGGDYNKAQIDKVIDGIDRFQSPLTFKPIATQAGYDIYINVNEGVDFEKIIASELAITVGNGKAVRMKFPQDFSFYDLFDFLSQKKGQLIRNSFLFKRNGEMILAKDALDEDPRFRIPANEYKRLFEMYGSITKN